MFKHAFIVVVLICLPSSMALAAESADGSEARFSSLDQNQDGHVSLYEAKDKHRVFYYYQKADKNQDGHLDKVEFNAFEIVVPEYMEK